MTTIMLRNTRTCDVTLDGVTIQAGRTQALEAAHVEQRRQHLALACGLTMAIWWSRRWNRHAPQWEAVKGRRTLRQKKILRQKRTLRQKNPL
ncbi:hypothetical protein MRX58_02330 [Xylella fastidiosa subsp. pauca]|uniref:hypothetical protein n=1 Tax=Xylella fastidiosa TaxID=2371 RepID=UPI00241E7E78|nr:hypothetical protein [Xylella fastidiosa]MDG5822413.1 hypothetical protein [Xylella fastidiosa subsp. pauca]